MAGEGFRYRTIAEVAVISAVIYVLLGAPGISSNAGTSSLSGGHDGTQAKAKVESLVYPAADLKCPEHAYSINLFSTSPLVIHIDNFVSEAEIQHLIALR